MAILDEASPSPSTGAAGTFGHYGATGGRTPALPDRVFLTVRPKNEKKKVPAQRRFSDG